MKSKSIVLSGIFALNAISCSTTHEIKEPKHPNIILVLVDDLGYGDLGCFGQKTLATPKIDQMAAEGVIFTNHYAGSTVCAPSRASLMTGRHTGELTVRGNFPPAVLADGELTLPKLLKQAGYVTGAIGKWGVGHPEPNDPERNGFDYFYGYVNMFHAHNFYPEFLYRNGQKELIEGNRLITRNGENPWAEWPEGTGVAETKAQHAHPLLENEIISFIETNKDTAFFLYAALNIPHANNEAGRDFNDGMEVDDYGIFADKPWPNPEKGFARMIQMIDETVGAINEKLEQLGIDENTLVVFVSDNGPHKEGNHSAEFFNSSGELRGTKRDLYEGGIRTPFIAKWPAQIKPGSKSGHISAFWDFLPTFSEITRQPLATGTSGISFLPALTGRENQQKSHEYLYWEFHEQGGKTAVRKGNWKAVRNSVFKEGATTELYDLSSDIAETRNVASQFQEVVKELEATMRSARTESELFPFPAIWKE